MHDTQIECTFSAEENLITQVDVLRFINHSDANCTCPLVHQERDRSTEMLGVITDRKCMHLNDLSNLSIYRI